MLCEADGDEPFPPCEPVPSLRWLHNERCRLLGITNPEVVERLWKEESAKWGVGAPEVRYASGD